MEPKDNNQQPLCLDKDTLPSQNVFTIEGVKFFSNFDSGNLYEVEKVAARDYNLWIANDCQGSQSERQQSSWFYFGIEGFPRGQRVTFTIKNFNKQCKLQKEGMLPVYKSFPSMKEWKRVQGPSFNLEPNGDGNKKLQFSFCHQFLDNEDTQVLFAYTYPWSLKDSDAFITDIFRQYQTKNDIYLHKELIINSPEGRPIELITLTSMLGKTDEKEPMIRTLFPENNRPYKFLHKEYVWISSRVHPGEVPASYMLNGIFRYLLKTDPKIGTNMEDKRIQMILDNFVFIIVPMLNPDGVYRGHYRVSNYGQNLNRYYKDPTIEKQPSCYATNLIMESLSKQKKQFMYLDQHAHANYKNCFIFGNHLPYRDHIESCIFGKLMDINCKWFDYDSCNFLQKNMYATEKGDALSKEGTGRVSQYLRNGIARSYTMEVNYNMSCKINKKLSRPSTNMNVIEPSYTSEVPCTLYEDLKNYKEEEKESTYHFFNTEDFEAFGKGVCISLLDLIEKNPNSRLSRLPYGNLKGLKIYLGIRLTKEIPFRFDTYLKNLVKKCDKEVEQKLQSKYILTAEKDESYICGLKEQTNANKGGYVIRTQSNAGTKNNKNVVVKSKVYELCRPSTKQISVIEKKEIKQEEYLAIQKKQQDAHKNFSRLSDVINETNNNRLLKSTLKYDQQHSMRPNSQAIQIDSKFNKENYSEPTSKVLLMMKTKNKDWNNYELSDGHQSTQKDGNIGLNKKKNKTGLQDTPAYYKKKKDIIITRNSNVPKSATGTKTVQKILSVYESSQQNKLDYSNKRNAIKKNILSNNQISSDYHMNSKVQEEDNFVNFTNNIVVENRPTIYKSPSSRNSSCEPRKTDKQNSHLDGRPFHQQKETILKQNNFKISNAKVDGNYNSFPVKIVSQMTEDYQNSTSKERFSFNNQNIHSVNPNNYVKNQSRDIVKKKLTRNSKVSQKHKERNKSKSKNTK